MRKSTLISLLLALVLIGGLAIWRYMPRALSYDECSTVYRHYADMQLEGVRVTYIKDKIINDSLRLPVTLIEAETNRGWEQLDSIFLGYIPEEVREDFIGDDTCFIFYRANIETPERQVGIDKFHPDDVTVYIYPSLHRISIFEPYNKQSSTIGDFFDAAFKETYPDVVTDKH